MIRIHFFHHFYHFVIVGSEGCANALEWPLRLNKCRFLKLFGYTPFVFLNTGLMMAKQILLNLLLLFLSLTSALSAQENRVVVLIPFNEFDTQDELLKPRPYGNFWHRLQEACAERSYLLTTTRDHSPEDIFAIVAFNAPSQDLSRYRSVPKILFTWEPPCIHPRNFDFSVHSQYDRIATWQDDLIDGKKYLKFHYALAFHAPWEIIPFQQKKLCCMFVGNKTSTYPNELYSERLKTIHFLEANAPQDFDFYGPDWGSDHPSYRGYADDKTETMKRYKFAIIYENTKNIQGYITEKLFDAFSSGCVPVYWGAENISDYIPNDTFIPREDFNDIAQLHAFLAKMTEERYNSYLKNIAAFLSSEQAYPFSCDHFIETFIEILDSLREAP